MIKRIASLAFLLSFGSVFSSSAQSLPIPSSPGPIPETIPKPIPKQTPRHTKPSFPTMGPLPLPGPAEEGKALVWRRGSNVESCTAPGQCVRRPMPKAIGKPLAVVAAPLVDKKLVTDSWLTVSNKRYSLCYMTASKQNPVVVCHPIKAPVMKGAKVRVITYPGIGSLLNFSVDPKWAKLSTREERTRALLAFGKGLKEAQVAAAKTAKRYSGNLIPLPNLNDTGGCMGDDGSTCDVGGEGGGGPVGDWWPDEPTGDDGSGDWWPDEAPEEMPSEEEEPAPTGDEGGGGDMPSESPDGGNGDDGGQIPVPTPFPFPPGPTPNGSGGTTDCFPTADGGTCIITAPKPDPNRTDPDTGEQLPPSKPHEDDTGWSWCDLPVIKWFCGTEPQSPEDWTPPEPIEADLPPFVWPPKPDDGRPFRKYRDGYQEELDRCDAELAKDETKCGINWVVLGGPIYKRKLEETGKLTREERKMLEDAKEATRVCRQFASDNWDKCYANARDTYRE